MERTVRLELTIPDLQSGALAAWRRAQIGTEGEIRTLESSLEDSHVSSYITSACLIVGRGGQSRTVATSSQDSDANATPHPETLVRQVRLELTIPCLKGRCLDPIWLLTHGGTERTRTVIGLVDNQVPHLSATVPKFGWVEGS